MPSLQRIFSLVTNIFINLYPLFWCTLSISSEMNLLLISVNATWQSSWIDLEANLRRAATFPLPAYSRRRALLRPARPFQAKPEKGSIHLGKVALIRGYLITLCKGN
jgi:hypothetical protein